MDHAAPPEDAIRAELDKVLASSAFRGANRARSLLRFVVESAIEGRARELKEYTLGAEALGRGETFDPRLDPIVRVETSRLRGRLDRYYAREGAADAVVIELPKGTYVPRFVSREAAAEHAPPHTAAPAAPPRGVLPARGSPRWRDGAWLASAIGLAVVIAFSYSFSAARQETPGPTPTLRLEAALGAPGVVAAQVGSSLALSRDGGLLAFALLGDDGRTRLYVRRLDSLDAIELEGTVGALGPFFSPDGQWVGFLADGRLKKTLAAGGGSPIVLRDAPDFLGAAWAEDDTIFATLDRTGALWRVSAADGAAEPVSGFDRELGVPRWPQLLPGDDAVLVTVGRGAESAIEAVRLADGERRTLVRAATYGRYLASGHLVYVDRGTVFAVPFDAERLEIRGAPVPVLTDVAHEPVFGFAQLAAADNGTLVYLRSVSSGLSTIRWLDGGDGSRPLLDEPARYQWPRVSPDGTRLVYGLLEGSDFDLWTMDLATGARTRVTGSGNQSSALWSGDGQYLIYSAEGSGLFAQRADGLGAPQRLLPDTAAGWSLTPDGSRLAYYAWSEETSFDLWTVPIESGADGIHAGTAETLLATRAFETYPAFSPDGRWLSYCSNESGAWEVYVRPFPNGDRRVQVSVGGGCVSLWSRGEPRLYYRTVDQRLMSLRYHADGDSFTPEPPLPWSSLRLADTGVLANFDVADAGVVALVAAGDVRPPRDRLTIVANFFEELRRTVPVLGR